MAALVAITSIVMGAELTTNSGFESGTTGWSNSGENSWWVVTSSTVHSGSKSASLTTWDDTSPYSGYRFIWQSVSHNGSSEYTLSVFARDNWSTGWNVISQAVTLKLEYYDASSNLLRTDQQSFDLPKNYKWYHYFFTSTDIPADTATIRPVIGTSINKVNILLDDVSLTGKSEASQHTGDLNNDLRVNLADLAVLAANWMKDDLYASQSADLTDDSSVDWSDLYIMSDNWLTDYASDITITPSSQTIDKYDSVFFDINSSAFFSNPYNPNDIRIDITFTDPDSNTISLPCFYVSGISGKSVWQGRFTPRKAGQYSYQAKVFVNDVLDSFSSTKYLTVDDSDKDGFIHLNPNSNYSFIHDSGKPFRGIGENISWDPRYSSEQTYTYEHMFPLLGDSGCNFVRVWMCVWNMPLEWTMSGLGRYNETAAERLDAVLALAEENGLYIMLTLDSTAALATEADYWGSNNYWTKNPYNTDNGGPCATAADFFTNTEAKELYKKRLRYIIARWGYNTHLCVFELFNEIDGAYNDGDANVPAADIVSWHSEMATYLKDIDPFKHLVSTSAGYKTIPNLWNVSNIDFSQTHPYGSTDAIYDKIVSFTEIYNKPYVAGEFGFGWEGPGTDGNQIEYERELRMGLWRGMFSPTPIVPLTWWWSQFDEWNDWNIFSAAAAYCSQMFSDSNSVLQKVSASAGTGMETMALKNGSTIFVWLRNNTLSTLSSSTLSVYNLSDGSYEVSYYDTLTGTYSASTLITVTTGTLQSSVPSLTADKDIACRIVQN